MNWIVEKPDQKTVKNIMVSHDVSKEIAITINNYGFSNQRDLKNFLSPSISNFHDPFLMKGMEKAINRIFKTIDLGQKIFILGDSDADGISAASLLYEGIKFFGGEVKAYIPNRKLEGRGLRKIHIGQAMSYDCDLLITCDCGMNSFESIEYANKKSIDVIITDHHLLNDKASKAYATLNPNQASCKYPFKGLSGSGVALKLLQGMIEYKNLKMETSQFGINFAIFGTLSDMVPLLDENRLIVKLGLISLSNSNNEGIKMLLKRANIRQPITALDLSRYIIPKLNSTARIGDSNKVFEFFTSRNMNKLNSLYFELEQNNEKRLDIQKQILREAYQYIKSKVNLHKDKVIICYSVNWEYGILGIIASKLKNQYRKPVVLISFNNDIGRGSFRSVKGFNLIDVLNKLNPYLESFGGHRMASGLKIKKSNFENFKEALLKYADLKVNKQKSKKNLLINQKIRFSEINSTLLRFLKKLEPYGLKNKQQKFMTKDIKVIGNPKLTTNGDNIKFIVRQGNKSFNAIGYGLVHLYEILIMGVLLDIVFLVDISRCNEKDIVQLNVKNIKLSSVNSITN
jgi:single-stranded-DNA-specific exonuclease